MPSYENDGIVQFEVGEFAENMPWRIIKDAYFHSEYRKEMCKHCVELQPGDPRIDMWSPYKDGPPAYQDHSHWIIPRAVYALNEGGFNCTIVCLDCILEAVGRLDRGEISYSKEEKQS